MELKDIISSGLLELYAAGLTSETESEEVEQWLKLYPKVAAELKEISAGVEAYAQLHAVQPSPQIKDKIFAVWGLAFKPNTDDIREAPALNIISALVQLGAKVAAFDPEAMPNVKREMGDKISYGENQYDVLKDADALIIITEWSVFRSPDFEQMKKSLKNGNPLS